MFRLTLHVRPCLILLPIIFFAQACAPQLTSTPFRPPTALPPAQLLATTTPVPALFTPPPALTAPATTTAGVCTNDLTFVDDITIADNTSVLPNASIDKQWLVQNSGTCNWDASYRLKWVAGSPLGAAEEQLLYPARAGAQAMLSIHFIAPAEAGFFESAWQAVDPHGNIFGELIFMKIVVTP
ncbi:MAG: NBR1-Ig-like domain-containing protein [Anaerolineales bacterium]|nr:NBR1-Ig-like domain-containing protein [Anaerolineales bacterium]